MLKILQDSRSCQNPFVAKEKHLILRPPPPEKSAPVESPQLSFKRIIEGIRSTFQCFTDIRKESNNFSYSMEDAAISAFSVFFTQSPSFPDYQKRMEQQRGKSNAQSLFGIHQIPQASQLRRLLDPVSPKELYPLISSINDELKNQGLLKNFININNTCLIPLDGTEFFSSEKISCSCCSSTTLKNGQIRYRHAAVTPMLVAPGQEHVIPLPPEFIHPQDGHEKQDCELAAATRWLEQQGVHYLSWGVTFLGDDLYCHQPFCQKVLESGAHFIFVCKPDSHKEAYEWLDDFSRNGTISTVTRKRWTGKEHLTDTYRFMHHIPLRNSDDALKVNWFELTTTTESGDIVFRNSWVTDHAIHERNIEALVLAGRARWHIENGGNNVLKTKGYHFDHNFGHGDQNLSNVLATLILLAYLTHTALDWLDERYHAIRAILPSRRTFFEHMRALIQYIFFDSWDQLMGFMLDGLNSPDTS